MRPVTKDGKTIGLVLFEKLLGYGKVLSQHGYIESAMKPNLFGCHYQTVSFYADMRGTREVPLWVDDRPLFYWYWHQPLSIEVRQKTVLVEWVRLGHMPLRLATIRDRGSIEESFFVNLADPDGTFMVPNELEAWIRDKA